MQDLVFGLFIPTISLVYAAVFFLLWLRARDKPYILGFVGANVAIALGFMPSFVAPGDIFMPLSLLPVLLIHTGGILTAWSICARVGQKVPIKTFFAIALLGTGLETLANHNGQMVLQLMISNMAHGLIIAIAVHALSYATFRTILDRVIMWFLGLYALQCLVRPAITIMIDGELTHANFTQSIYAAASIIATGLLLVLLATTLIVTTLVDQFREQEERTISDHLTGLKSRRPFEEAAVEMLDEAMARKIPVSMIVADIDHFKQVNDLWGHLAGDQAIAAFGQKIERMIRDTDIGGRIGGEEFCIIAWNCELAAASGLAERIRTAFASMQHEGINPDVRLTASFGVTEWQAGEGYGKLFARADAALYRAKDSGRNKVFASTSLLRRVSDLGDIDKRLPRAFGS